MIAQDLKSALQELCPDLEERDSLDWPAFNCPIAKIPELAQALRDERDYNALMDATAIDNGVDASPRFTVVYHLFSTKAATYVRLAADCESDEEPSAPTLTDLFKSANWMERETFDLMGIRYEGHPDLRRILMWDEYPHHPLRKDFPLAGFESELSDEEIAANTGVKVKPAPMAGGPFVAQQSCFESKREPTAKDESWNEAKEKPEK
jgi:NADH-quinone oxidoreductase subunit C